MLAALVAAAVGLQSSSKLSFAAAGATKKRTLPWRNWSGSQQCLPAARVAPASVAELQELIALSKGTVRPVGSGHSFTALVPTDDTIVSLSRLSGLVDHDPQRLQSTLWAGTRLGDVGKPLEDVGQAMINLPDIDEQTLAGSLATATHGTGAGIGCLSTFVEGLQLVDGQGDLVDCDANNNAEIFQAAKVSMGVLGVITQVRLQNVAPYRLRRDTVWHEFDEILEIAEDMADQYRNFELYYIPFSGMGYTESCELTDESVAVTEKIDSNESLEDLKMARDWLDWSPRLRELIVGGMASTIKNEVTVASSWKNYPSERNVRFNEMEYNVPREYGLQVLREIRTALETQHHEVFFPIEMRYVREDDIWLSPFYERDTCTIAVHRYFNEDFTPYFKTIEPIFRKYHGRPHWGKLNTLQRSDFRKIYPRWDDFVAVRRELDPKGLFLNPYLRELFH